MERVRNDESDEIRLHIGVSYTVESVSALSDEELNVNRTNLTDNNWDIRRAAVNALGQQARLSFDILCSIVVLLEDENQIARGAAIEALGTIPVLPQGIFQDLADGLNNPDIKRAAVEALGKQRDLPGAIIQDLVPVMQDENAYVRAGAIQALAQQAELSPDILNAMVALLSDENIHVRGATVQALGQRVDLPQEILEILVPHATSLSPWQIQCLGQRTDLPDRIVQALAIILDDEGGYVQKAAIQALGQQSRLSPDMLKHIAAK